MKVETLSMLIIAVLVPPTTVAGRQVTADVGIIDGEEAKDGEFPYIVSLREFKDLGWTHICGGAVIADHWIVTAAHCCVGRGYYSLSAVAGGIKLDIAENEEQRKNIDKIIYHEDYNYTTITNDICVVKLSSPFEWTDYVQPVALPEPFAETAEGTIGTIAGWGYTSDWKIFPNNHLMTVSVPIISDVACNNTYAELNDTVVESMICIQDAENTSKGTCSGDSGGPLTVRNDDNTTTLTGLVSWGAGACATSGYPSVFTQVSYFVDWINEKLAWGLE